MTDKSQRVLPFTLAEVLTLLFFVLGLALAFERAEAVRASEQLEDLEEALGDPSASEIDALTRAIRELRDQAPDDFEELIRGIASEVDIREVLTEHLGESGMDPTAIDSLSTRELVDSVMARVRNAEALSQALAESAGLSSDSVAQLGEVAAHLGETERERRDLEERLQDLQSQFRYLVERAGNGLDHPPCWATPDGEIEYAYEVTLLTGHVHVQSIWPAHRGDDAAAVPGMLSLTGLDIPLDAFADLARPVYLWSTRQDPECRHFVRILDGVEGGKEAYKTALLTVETFFYKLLVN